MRKCFGAYIACVAVGFIGGVLFMKNKEKVKPMAAQVLAKGLLLKEKAMSYAAQSKEHAEDIVAEAKHIKDKPTHAKS